MRVRVRHNFLELAKDGHVHPGLQASADYYVLQADDENYRVVNRRGEPVLYPKELFEVVDRAVPSGWQFREYGDGEYFLEPSALGRPGFYEEWFGSDGDRPAQQAARSLLREELARSGKVADEEDRRLIHEALARLPDEQSTS